MVGRAGRAGHCAIGESFILSRGAPLDERGEWGQICALLTAPLPVIRSPLLPAACGATLPLSLPWVIVIQAHLLCGCACPIPTFLLEALLPLDAPLRYVCGVDSAQSTIPCRPADCCLRRSRDAGAERADHLSICCR
jgi:hypothetical protein